MINSNENHYLIKYSPAKFIWLPILISINGCSNVEKKGPDFLAITNQPSVNCNYKDSSGTIHPIAGCQVQGKLILTNPTDNLSYVLYRKGDSGHSYPVLCTLPAQAAEALTKIRKAEATISIPKVPITGKGESQDNSSIVVLNKDDDMSSALYVLSSSFSLCMAYASNAINEESYEKAFMKILDNAVKGKETVLNNKAAGK